MARTQRMQVMLTRFTCIAWIAATCSTAHAADLPPLTGITIEKESLSVKLQDVPLGVVVMDIAARSGIDLHMDNAAALPRVTAHFSNLPFAEGLAQLLKNAPGSLVVSHPKHGYGGVSALYVIASQGDKAPLPTPPPQPASLEEIRRGIATLQAREMSPSLRQAYEDARAPARDGAAQARSLRRTQNLDSLLREIEGPTAQGNPRADGRPGLTQP